jgi:hypothetical protein
MSPNRKTQRHDAEAAAGTLQGLLRDPTLVQLLQQPPPAEVDGQQHELLRRCYLALQHLEEILPESVGSGTAVQQLTGVLRHEAAHSAAVLMAWVQQRPKLLQPILSDISTVGFSSSRRIYCVSPTAIWVCSRRVLDKLVLAINRVSSSSAAALAAEMTRQLGRSGALHQAKLIQVPHLTLT